MPGVSFLPSLRRPAGLGTPPNPRAVRTFKIFIGSHEAMASWLVLSAASRRLQEEEMSARSLLDVASTQDD